MENSRKPPNSQSALLAQVEHQLHSLRLSEATLCLALSGGMDSVVLADTLYSLQQSGRFHGKLLATHVNHGLSKQAGQWQQFCSAFCQQRNIPLKTVSVVINTDAAIEAQARELRHQALACGHDGEFIITLAQHGNDQAETLLHRLLRGTGVRGAASMRRLVRGRHGKLLFRPLLDCPRSELEAYAKAAKLIWVEDESNLDQSYTRNKLRHSFMTPLQQAFPGAVQNFGKAARHFQQASDLLDEMAAQDATNLAADGMDDSYWLLEKFNQLSLARRINVLHYRCRQYGYYAADAVRLQEVLRQLENLPPGRPWMQALANYALFYYDGRLWLGHWQAPPEQGEVVALKLQATSVIFASSEIQLLTANGGIDLQKLPAEAPVYFGPWRGAALFRPNTKASRRSLAKLFQQHRVPPWLRQITPVLWCADQALWVGGLGVHADYQVGQGASGLMPQWQSNLGKPPPVQNSVIDEPW